MARFTLRPTISSTPLVTPRNVVEAAASAGASFGATAKPKGDANKVREFIKKAGQAVGTFGLRMYGSRAGYKK